MTRRSGMRANLTAVLILTLLLAGCGGSEETGTAESTAVSGETAASAETPETTAADTSTAKSGTMRVALSNWSLAYTPMAITFDRMTEMGYDIQPIEVASNANQLQAATQGEVDVTTIAQVMDAIDQGLDFKFFMGTVVNEYIMVGKQEFDSCSSLDGQRVGIHSEASFVGQLALQWFASECPDANPEILVIEGSENRLQALLQDQLDASPIDWQDWVQLDNAMPDTFGIIANYSEELPILRGAYGANPEWMAENETMVRDLVATHLEVLEDIEADPQLAVDKATEIVEEVDPELLPQMVEMFIENKVWKSDGSLDSMQDTIDFLNADDHLTTISSADDIVDTSILDAVNSG